MHCFVKCSRYIYIYKPIDVLIRKRFRLRQERVWTGLNGTYHSHLNLYRVPQSVYILAGGQSARIWATNKVNYWGKGLKYTFPKTSDVNWIII